MQLLYVDSVKSSDRLLNYLMVAQTLIEVKIEESGNVNDQVRSLVNACCKSA